MNKDFPKNLGRKFQKNQQNFQQLKKPIQSISGLKKDV